MIKPRVSLNAPPAEQTEPGMTRFFNSQNLERYRKLASDVTTATERQQVLQLLAEEMNAFKNEIKKTVASCST